MALQLQLPLETLREAANLYNRYQEGAGFKAYLKSRTNLVALMVALIMLTAIACTAGTVVSLAGARAYLMLFVLLLAPFVLLGCLFVQVFFFFGWLENRALAKGLKHALEREGPVARWMRKNLRAEMGKFPPVPWILATLFLFLPLALTAAVVPKIAAALVAVYAAAIVLFARVDA